MKSLIWAAFAAFILSSCAEYKFDNNLQTEIDTEALPYAEKFAGLYGASMPPLIIKIGELESGVALCERYESGQKVITINRATWDAQCDAGKQAVIFHELGHCVLGRDHVGVAVLSYMRQVLYECSFYMDNDIALIAELFDIVSR